MKREQWIKRIGELDAEFKALLDNPRADEIITNEWFHDDTLPIPSVGLIELVSVQLLHDSGCYDWFLRAAEDGLVEAIRSFVKQSRDYTTEIRERLVRISVARMHLSSFVLGLQPEMLGWWLAKESLDLEGFEGTPFPEGKRRLARCMLESLTLRAFLLNDLPQQEGLCAVTRIRAGKATGELTASQYVARGMFVWLPFLTQKLGRVPSISEMKMFLLEIDPGISESDTTWSQSKKHYFKWDVQPRARKTDSAQILKIAREAAKEGPRVKRVASWRTPPKCFK